MNIFTITNERRFKVKIYAFFQFVSFASFLSILLSIGLMGYFLMVHGGTIGDTAAWWTEFGYIAKGIYTDPLSSSATAFFYIGITMLLVSYLVGFSIVRATKRNLYDSLFLLFVIIPGISNVFALMAQVSSREIVFANARIDKKSIIQAELKKLEETRQIAIKQLEAKNKLLQKMKISNIKQSEKKDAIKIAKAIKANEAEAIADKEEKIADKEEKTAKKAEMKAERKAEKKAEKNKNK